LSSHTRRVINRASDALRWPQSLGTEPIRSGRILSPDERPARSSGSYHSDRAQTGPDHLPSVKHGEAYVRQGLENYERKFRERNFYALRKTATSMGFNLIAKHELGHQFLKSKQRERRNSLFSPFAPVEFR